MLIDDIKIHIFDFFYNTWKLKYIRPGKVLNQLIKQTHTYTYVHCYMLLLEILHPNPTNSSPLLPSRFPTAVHSASLPVTGDCSSQLIFCFSLAGAPFSVLNRSIKSVNQALFQLVSASSILFSLVARSLLDSWELMVQY